MLALKTGDELTGRKVKSDVSVPQLGTYRSAKPTYHKLNSNPTILHEESPMPSKTEPHTCCLCELMRNVRQSVAIAITRRTVLLALADMVND